MTDMPYNCKPNHSSTAGHRWPLTLAKEMKTVFHIGIWLAVLVGGVLTVGFLFQRTCQGGTGNGAGFFNYSFRCEFFSNAEEDPSISYVELEGQAPRRFKFYGGVSPIYETISMKWSLNTGYVGRPEGHILLNLAKNTINDDGRSVPLDSNRLLEVMGIPDRLGNRATLKYLLDILRDCHTGQLPRPSHFSYRLEEPMPGSICHVAHGYKVDYYVLTWGGIWLVAIPVFYTIKRLTSRWMRRREAP